MAMKSIKGKGIFRSVIFGIVTAATMVMFLFIFLFSPYKIVGNSMSPTLNNGEKILISKSLLIGKISRFDIVVIVSPDNNRRKLIKRVVGLPEEEIEIIKGNIFIDNELKKENFLKYEGDVIFKSSNMRKSLIPANSYFLLGDCREKSTDSRNFGPVCRDRIVGKILFRYFPLNKFGIVK